MVSVPSDQPTPSEPHEQQVRQRLGYIYRTAPIIYKALSQHPQLLDVETGRVLIHRWKTEPEIHIAEGEAVLPQHLYHETNTYIGKPNGDTVEIWEENIVGESKYGVEDEAVDVEDVIAADILLDKQINTADSSSPFDEALIEIEKSNVKGKRVSTVRFRLDAEGVQEGAMLRQAFADPEVEAMWAVKSQNPFKEHKISIGSAELEMRVRDFSSMFEKIVQERKLA